jgi:hypothetical protein
MICKMACQTLRARMGQNQDEGPPYRYGLQGGPTVFHHEGSITARWVLFVSF